MSSALVDSIPNLMRPGFRDRVACWLLLFGWLLVVPRQDAVEKGAAQEVLARVGDSEVTAQALLRWLRKSFPNYATDTAEQAKITLAAFSPALIKGALEHLVNRMIVLDYLRKNGLGVSPEEIKLDLENLANQLAQMDSALEDYLKKEEITRKELESEIEWKIAWARYLAKVLNDEYLLKHFERHRRRFDHSEMRVAHLLITAQDRSEADAVKLAEQIYKQIQSGQITELEHAWSAAVSQHSQAPSKERGGDIGWIRFHEPMPESFSAAAFSLKVGEVSRPVVTKFGVHLIRCLDLKEGKVGWRDASTTVRDHAAKTLFERIAKKHRTQVSITIN
jgi:parvulin-like peptidyl-prolyl isomerase